MMSCKTGSQFHSLKILMEIELIENKEFLQIIQEQAELL